MAYQMIHVGNKPLTRRVAIATGRIVVGRDAFKLIQAKKIPKGDPLALAEIAGIQGAKKAFEMIPLCHPLILDSVEIKMECDPEHSAITVYCLAFAEAKTGVEMEALSGVNAALLTIYDLTKMVEPALQLDNIRLLAKLGGKSGLWFHPAGVPEWVDAYFKKDTPQSLLGLTASVITLSDRASEGVYQDRSGPILANWLRSRGAIMNEIAVLPDDPILLRNKILASCENKTALVITTGGTGVSERDVTPETLLGLLDRMIPGVGELLRSDGARYTPYAWSSRAVAGILQNTLVISLPGNPNAVQEGLGALEKLIPHLLKIMGRLS